MAWPKGVPRKRPVLNGALDASALSPGYGESAPTAPVKRSWKNKAVPNWEAMNPDEDSPDRFRIPPHMIPEGFDLQWVTDTVYGQPQPQLRSDFEKKGWTPVHQSDFDGQFDGMFMKRGEEGEINSGGQVLMYRPLELSIRARHEELRRAKEQMAIKEAALRGGDIPGVGFETQHESIHNKVSRSWERVAVPTDD